MFKKVINIILAIAIVEGRSPFLPLQNRDVLPAINFVDCPDDVKAQKCFQVEDIGMIAVTQESETVYEGSLTVDGEDEPYSVVVIYQPDENSLLVNFNHPSIPHCDLFDVDLETFEVACVSAGYDTEEDDEEVEELKNRGLTNGNTNGPIINLGADFPNGIDVKVLFTFDQDFRNTFGMEGGRQVIALVKNAYKDQSLKRRLGTHVNIIGTATKYSGTFTDADFPWRNDQIDTCLMGQKASAQGAKYDLYTFITHPGASGVAFGGQVCSSNPKMRISMNKAYGARQCGFYDPPSPIDCSKKSNRIGLTAETISHELGHSLGMAHDFSTKNPYVYRKYETESDDCRGLMDYIDDGVGWSACSARDFSRYLTNGGTTKSCLGNSGGTCADTSNGAADNWGDGCPQYAQNKGWCGNYNNAVFQSEKMCCCCGGGSTAAAGK